MKVAINCIFFQPRGGGIMEYIYNLTKNLAIIDDDNEYVLYVLSNQINFARKNLPSKFRIKPVPYKSGGLLNVIKRCVFDRYFWDREEQLERWDIFHSPFFYAPKLRYTKLILTVHDLRFFRYPETYTFLRSSFLKFAVKQSVYRASQIISISEFTKNELISAYSLPSSKISVVKEAINIDRFKDSVSIKCNLPEDIDYNTKYILTVGHLEPRKNYNRLIDAYSKLKKSGEIDDYKLVIVGKKSHSYTSTLKKIEENNVVYLDFVSHDLLVWLYQHAQLFVFPSIYEGFGFPPLEAGVHGTISAVSSVSSIPEVCGDAAIYFNPYDVDDMAGVILRALTDMSVRTELKSKIVKQVESFSWRKNAIETSSIYKMVEQLPN